MESEESELKSSTQSESFTSLILRTLPTCWRRIRPEEGETDDGGFREHRLRTSRLQLTQSDQFSSLQPRYFRPGETLQPSYSSPDRSLTKHRRIFRKTGGPGGPGGPGGTGGRYLVNPPVILSVAARERELRHYNSCHTFTPSTLSSSTVGERTRGQVVYRRPHSVDLGGVGRARVRQSLAHLSDEFRRVGIGTCLEGGLFPLLSRNVLPLLKTDSLLVLFLLVWETGSRQC